MIFGFTGTRQGMSRIQKTFLISAMMLAKPKEFHHGDCVGADADAHKIIRNWVPICRIVIHPPGSITDRAFCEGDEARPMKPYLVRNRNIVDSCDVLIAAPLGEDEEWRSGTWSTIRYARKRGTKVYILKRNVIDNDSSV